MKTKLLICTLLFAASLAAAPAAVSITPSAGPTAGGTQVTIAGDFAAVPHEVYFGAVRAQSTTRVNEHTLVAVTPAHLAGVSRVSIAENGGSRHFTALTFTFDGGVPEEEFVRILLPLFIPEAPGAFGSVFRTDLWAIAKRTPVHVYGVAVECPIICVPGGPETDVPAEIPTEEGVYIPGTGTPARFVYVPREHLKELSMTLLAFETSRGELTALPVVRFDEAADTHVALPSVDLSTPRRRATLRIYAVQPARVTVKVGRVESVEETVQLAPGRNIFEPAYAVWSNFPNSEPMVDVRLTSDVPVWALLTLTDNSTQRITAIAPQP